MGASNIKFTFKFLPRFGYKHYNLCHPLPDSSFISNLGRRLGTSKMHLSPIGSFGFFQFLGKLFCCCCFIVFVPPIICGGSEFVIFWYALLYVLYSFAVILPRKKELVALLLLSFGCNVTVNVLWLFFTMPWVRLRFVVVVFPDNNHLLLR